MRYVFFSIIKGPLKPNFLPNIRYFYFCLFSSLQKLVFPQEVGENENFFFLKFRFDKFFFGSDTEIGPWFPFLIPKLGFGRTLPEYAFNYSLIEFDADLQVRVVH